MNYRSLISLLLILFSTQLLAESREDRRIQRIDREVSKRVFISKGTWMTGGTVSYSEHEEANLNFMVLKDFESDGYSFSVSPYFGYFFKDNMAVGGRFTYHRSYMDLGNVDINLGGLEINLNEVYYLEHKYDVTAFYRSYMSIGSSKIFGLFNEMRLTYGHGQGKNSTGKGVDYDGTYQTIQNLKIGFSPGLTAFITNRASAEVSIGVMGFDFKWIDQKTNQVEVGKRRVSSGNFKINLFSINLGMTLYL